MSTSHNTFSIGKVFFHFPLLVSTNEQASNLLAKSNPIEGTVISAAYQSAGKGQLGNRWESEIDKNIMMSIIIYPTFLPLADSFKLNIATSLAIKDYLSNFAENIQIKWPNDIYINNKKMGGILIQNAIIGHQLQSSIIGIGLNINQLKFDEHLPFATSLSVETNKSFELQTIRNGLFESLENRLIQLKNRQNHILEKDYLGALYRIDQLALFERKNGEKIEGTIRNVMPNGQLLVEIGAHHELFDLKEIKFL